MMLVSWLSWCSWWFFFCCFQCRPIKGRLNRRGRKPGSRSTRTVNMNILLLSMATTVILSQMEGYTGILQHLSEYVSEFLGISGGSLIYLRPHHMLQWMLKFRLMLDAGGHWTVVFFIVPCLKGNWGPQYLVASSKGQKARETTCSPYKCLSCINLSSISFVTKFEKKPLNFGI